MKGEIITKLGLNVSDGSTSHTRTSSFLSNANIDGQPPLLRREKSDAPSTVMPKLRNPKKAPQKESSIHFCFDPPSSDFESSSYFSESLCFYYGDDMVLTRRLKHTTMRYSSWKQNLGADIDSLMLNQLQLRTRLR
ncbi:unnamed protein product [Vicia faba]|uniref:Uncharacterized protein n=1 Tax=Vicia faba TaxID=3906 RepID=A0AAV0ZQ82_VICFA|nr:unnamed protein product [Vicia faba]